MKTTFSEKWLEIALAAAFILAGLLIAFGNQYNVLDWFLTDDAFYYFKIAQNIAEGHGSTFDGVNLTNGYHPLWLFLNVPVFALARFDLILPLRIVILISTGLGAAAAVVFYRLLRQTLEKQIALIAVALWAFSWTLFRRTTMGGMESILSAFFILLLWYRAAQLNQQPRVALKQIWLVGLIAAFTFLSRLDNIFLVFFTGVWIWLRWWQPGTEDISTSRQRWLWRLKTGVSYFLPVTLVLLVYLGINQAFFGTAFPISSQVKVWWGTLGLTIYGGPLYIYPEYIFEYLLPKRRGVGPWSLITVPIHEAAIPIWKKIGRDFTLEPLAITYGLLGLALAAVVAPGFKRFWKYFRRLGLLPFFAACMAQSVYYFWRDFYHLRPWYWVSQNIYLFILLGVLASVVYGYISEWNVSRALLTVISAGVTILIIANFARSIVQKAYPEWETKPHFYQMKAEAIAAHIPSDQVISATGSGSMSYFMPEYQVVNLDGLVNSAAYLEHLKAGTAIEFLDEMNVAYIIGNAYIITEARPYGDNFGPYLQPYAEFQIESSELRIFRVIYPP